MIQRRSEILPECGVGAWVVRREQQRQHVSQTTHAGGTDQHSKHKRETDCQLATSYEDRKKLRVRQHEVSQDRCHERIRPVSEETVDPELKTAVQRELRAEDFVLGKNQEQDSDCDAQKGQSSCVSGLRIVGVSHLDLLGTKDLMQKVSRVWEGGREPGR